MKRKLFAALAIALSISISVPVFAEEPDTEHTEEDDTDEEATENDSSSEDDETDQNDTDTEEYEMNQEDTGTEENQKEDIENVTEDTLSEKEETVLDILEEIDSLVGAYDITAEELSVESDLEANFQTDEYSNTGSHIIGGSEDYTAEENDDNNVISIGSIADDGTSTIRAEHSIETTIILDDDINITEEDENGDESSALTITVKDETGTITNASEEDGTLIIEDIEGNVAEILDAVGELAIQLSEVEADIEIDRVDQNQEIIDAASVDAQVVVVDAETVSGWTETDSDGTETTVEKLNYQSGMQIYISEDQIVVINVTTSEDCDKVILTQFTIYLTTDDGTQQIASQSNSDENSSIASQIILNFGDYSGEIYIQSGYTGTIIAPYATLVVGSTSTGQAIVQSFSNPGGEWHGSGEGTDSEEASSDDEETPDDNNTPGEEDQNNETPDDETPSDETPGDETPIDETPGDVTPDDEESSNVIPEEETEEDNNNPETETDNNNTTEQEETTEDTTDTEEDEAEKNIEETAETEDSETEEMQDEDTEETSFSDINEAENETESETYYEVTQTQYILTNDETFTEENIEYSEKDETPETLVSTESEVVYEESVSSTIERHTGERSMVIYYVLIGAGAIVIIGVITYRKLRKNK